MKDSCCNIEDGQTSKKYRKILFVALVINALMFLVEILSSYLSNSVSLLADSIDFLGDSANYGISLFVLSYGIKTRAKASLFKALSMGLFGIWVIFSVIYQIIVGEVPHAETMGVVGLIALAANVSVAMMLYKYREGDSNMQSVWLCTKNDVIGNILVMLAAIGVTYTNTNLPDLFVAVIMGFMALSASVKIFKKATYEIRSA